MLKSIRDFFDRNIAQDAPTADRHSVELATAALLVEVVRSDAGISASEQKAVLRAVSEKFNLSEQEAQAIFDLAEQEVRTANDYYQFTSLINRHFDQQHKQHVIELMWRVAYADAELAAHENHVLRRVAELLHVTHGDYIAAKMRARDAAERGDGRAQVETPGRDLSVAIAQENFDSAIASAARFGVVAGDRLASAATIDLEAIRGYATRDQIIARCIGTLQ